MENEELKLELKCKGRYSELSYWDWFSELINNIKKKNESERTVFEDKLLTHKGMIIKSCNRYNNQLTNNEDYADLIQESMIILQKTIDNYRPIVKGKEVKFSSYLFIMLNGYLQKAFNERFRVIKLTQISFKNNNIKEVEFNMTDEQRNRAIDKEFYTMSIDNSILVTQLLSELNDKERELIDLYFYEGLSYNEIGRIQSCSKQNISVKINNILKKLKKGCEK